jgi:hypothetical protein
LILLGYSKGTTDILHFLVAYPDLALRIEAVLSVAGAVNGSPWRIVTPRSNTTTGSPASFRKDASPGIAGCSTA